MEFYPSPPRSSPQKSLNARPLCKRPAPPVTPPNQMIRTPECPGAPRQNRVISFEPRDVPRRIVLVGEEPVAERRRRERRGAIVEQQVLTERLVERLLEVAWEQKLAEDKRRKEERIGDEEEEDVVRRVCDTPAKSQRVHDSGEVKRKKVEVEEELGEEEMESILAAAVAGEW